MKSSEFLPELIKLKNFRDIEVSGLKIDSREVHKGDIFFAIRGHKLDGNEFIKLAFERGASLVIADTETEDTSDVIYFKDLRQHIGIFASRFYGDPSLSLKTICITGTNGKTTAVETFSGLSNLLGSRCAYMSTVNFSMDGLSLEKASLTTPDAISIHRNMKNAIHNDAKYLAMEASSHGLEQHRLNGIDIDYAVLTSFSHDHLDYHGDINHYKSAKEKLFFDLHPKSNIICIDSSFGRKLYEDLLKINPNTYSVSIKQKADFQASFKESPLGIKVNLLALDQELTFELKTISKYLASNIICSMAILSLEGFNNSLLEKYAQDINLPSGRLEKIVKDNLTAYVDYAHTPEALRCALEEIKRIHNEPLWCVFGCGGDRDKEKRPLMGAVAQEYSDHIVITNDNPRTEGEMQIINDILSGMDAQGQFIIEPDREKAIHFAVAEIKNNLNGGVMLIAGKGHETYQEIDGNLFEFNDKEIVQSSMGL